MLSYHDFMQHFQYPSANHEHVSNEVTCRIKVHRTMKMKHNLQICTHREKKIQMNRDAMHAMERNRANPDFLASVLTLDSFPEIHHTLKTCPSESDNHSIPSPSFVRSTSQDSYS